MNQRRLFQLIALLLAGLVLGGPATAQPAAQTAEDLPIGFHIPVADDAHMRAVAQAGGDFAVVVFAWEDMEPTPNYLYWERTDAALAAADFHGVEIYARLDRPPTWAETPDGPTPWSADAYAAFVSRTVIRYGDRLAGVILWNEPNLALEWHGQAPDPAAYVALLRAGYAAAKAAAPDLPVLMAGLAFTQGDGVNAVNDLDYLRAVYAAGGGAYFDALAAHPYGFGAPPQQEPTPDRLNFRRLELHRAIMQANGDGAKPVVITEMGWRTRSPDPADAWQVVTPQQQADFTVQAIEVAGARYPWLSGMAFWEINGREDLYGYNLWDGSGPDAPQVPAYVALTDWAGPTTAPGLDRPAQPAVQILAADVAVRLGDRGELHPHWVHLYRNGGDFSPNWTGEFYLSAAEIAAFAAGPAPILRLETMQIDQPTNRVLVNGTEIGHLAVRTRPDPTSTWVSQALAVPADGLRSGVNTVEVISGLRNPARQYAWWRWENLQIRNLRLAPADRLDPPNPELAWTPLPSPSGWAETNRLHHFANGGLWATGNRAGQFWYGVAATGYKLANQSLNRADRIFVDVLDTPHGTLAATDRGLLYQLKSNRNPLTDTLFWDTVDAPAAYAYRVTTAHFYGQDAYVAGFEGQGVWAAYRATGPWFPLGLGGRTVLDLAQIGPDLYAATDAGVVVWSAARPFWRPLPAFPADAPGKYGKAPEPFTARLFVGQDDELVARSQDRLWRWDDSAWLAFGPEALQGSLYAVADCCNAGAVVGTFYAGLWQLAVEGDWRQIDGGLFNDHEITDLVRVEEGLLVGATTGIFLWEKEGMWHKLDGLPPVVTDLVRLPGEREAWLAATPAGIYLSTDRGQRWQPNSPPWAVWDLALSADNQRVFAARSRGVARADLPRSPGPVDLSWRAVDGMETILFFNVDPNPTQPDRLWAGSWGNNVGVSEAGTSLAPLHNGLETLSVLDVLWHPIPGQITVATVEGLFRTDDGGASWFKLPGPLQSQTVHALHQSGGGVIWAGAADGLWSSRDYGVTWARAADLPPITVLRLGEVGDRLWAGTEGAGLWLSADGGITWASAGLDGRTVYALMMDGEGLVVATDHGVVRSDE